MISWITNYIGTAAYGEAIGKKGICIVDVRDMVDREGNINSWVREKIEEALSHSSKGQKVVICCDYGMSRSNAVAAGVLAKSEKVTFNEALKRVICANKEEFIKIEVLSAVRGAVEGDQLGGVPKVGVNKRILITGGSGAIGSVLLPALDPTCEVFAPRRDEIDIIKNPIALDLVVKERGIDTIVHLANPHIYITNPAMGGAIVMLKNVLDVCKENKTKLIFLSGWEIYSGYRSRSLLAAEDLAPFPKGVYGETKTFCEKLIEYQHSISGIDYVILRSGPIYGSGDRPKFIYNFIKHAIDGKDIVTHKYKNGFPHLDLLHVNDIVSAVGALISRDISGVFNIGSSKAVSTDEVARMIVELSGSKSLIKHCNIRDYAPNIVMDISRIQEELGWGPTVDVRDGLRDIIERFKKLGAEGG